MPNQVYSLARIASFDGPVPTLDAAATYEFDDLAGFPLLDQQEVKVVQQPGVDGHGVVLGARRSPEFTVTAMIYTVGIAAGYTLLRNLQDLRPSDTGTDHGVAYTAQDYSRWAFDVLGVQLAAQPKQLAALCGDVVNPAATHRFRYKIRMKQRVD